MLLTRAPVYSEGRSPLFSRDLHVLSTPPAFALSQDQTLQLSLSPPCLTARAANLNGSRLLEFSLVYRPRIEIGALPFSFQRPRSVAQRASWNIYLDPCSLSTSSGKRTLPQYREPAEQFCDRPPNRRSACQKTLQRTWIERKRLSTVRQTSGQGPCTEKSRRAGPPGLHELDPCPLGTTRTRASRRLPTATRNSSPTASLRCGSVTT